MEFFIFFLDLPSQRGRALGHVGMGVAANSLRASLH